MKQIIAVGDLVKTSKSENALWWKVIGLIPLPLTNGTKQILIVRQKRRRRVDVSKVKLKKEVDDG